MLAHYLYFNHSKVQRFFVPTLPFPTVKFICTPFTPLHTDLYLLSISLHTIISPLTVFSPDGLNFEHRAFTVDGCCQRRGRRTVSVAVCALQSVEN